MPKKYIFSILVAVLVIMSLSCGVVNVQIQSGTYPPFIKAAQKGDIAEAEKLLKSGELVSQKTIGNQTALHIAAAEGQVDMVIWLLSQGADADAKDQNGKTPADFAVSQGHAQTAQLILDSIKLFKDEKQAYKTGDIEALRKLSLQDVSKHTVLHLMVTAGDVKLVKSEIKTGADVNSQTVHGFTPLHNAVISGNIEICNLLIEAGADVNLVDIYNNSPLYYAVFYQNKELVHLGANGKQDVIKVDLETCSQ
jgi:ankyrin repeat protein